MRIAAAILAGGQAKRLGGAAKGLLSVAGGPPIVERLLDQLAAAGIEDVVVVAKDPGPYASLGKPIVGDLRPGNGPLGGIETALHRFAPRYDCVLLLPCDLPNFSTREMITLIDAHRLAPNRVTLAQTHADRQHPLCAVVPVAMLCEVEKAIEAGDLGVGRLWRMLGTNPVSIGNPQALFNVNTPEDLSQWRQAADCRASHGAATEENAKANDD